MNPPNRLFPSGISDNVSQLLISSAHKPAFQKSKPRVAEPGPAAKSRAPDPKHKMADWSEYEELTIFVHVKQLKCRWVQIAKKFPQRSRIAVRNKFIHSFTRYKFGQHDAMFRKLILNRTIQDLGGPLRRSNSQSGSSRSTRRAGCSSSWSFTTCCSRTWSWTRRGARSSTSCLAGPGLASTCKPKTTGTRIWRISQSSLWTT